MNDHIQVKSEALDCWFQIKCIASDWHDDSEVNATFKRTIGNTLAMSFGPSYKVYRGIAKISDNGVGGGSSCTGGGADAGLVTVAQLRVWAESNDIGYRRLFLIDHHNVGPVPVFLTVSIRPDYQEPTKKFVYVPFEFWQRA